MMISIILLLFLAYAWTVILKKAGYSPIWVIVGLIPIIGIVLIWVFAFKKWPATHKRLS